MCHHHSRIVGVLLVLAACATPLAQPPATQDATITRPVVAETTSPIETIAPVARDGHRGLGLLRKPPGPGPFPAVVIIHGGLGTAPRPMLDAIMAGPMASRFLAAGYVVAVITYRSREADPQMEEPIADSIAAVEHLRSVPYVDRRSTVIYGCSGGGDLALQTAMSTELAAIAPEEPASVLFTGVLNKDVARGGEKFSPKDAAILMSDPLRFYTAPFQARTREKLARIHEPMLILQGDRSLETRFNEQVLIPELRAAKKAFDVITYPGEPHCFAFNPRSERPEVARKAFQDTDAFFRKHLPTTPKPIDRKLITEFPVNAGSVSLAITVPEAKTSLFAGKWLAAVPAAQDAIIALTVNGSSVTGTIKVLGVMPELSVEIFDGKIAADTISFKVNSPTGGRVITFVGTLNGSELAFARSVVVPPDGLAGGAGIFGRDGAPAFVARRTP
jgi:dienelactone hydrolase